MDIVQSINAIVLGVIEGATEFIPVSSTGHLIIANEVFRFQDAAFSKLFDIFIQSGAILAVAWYFRRRLLPVYKNQNADERNGIRAIWWRALIAFIPAVVLGVIGVQNFVQDHLFNPLFVSIMLIFWGFVIVILEYRQVNNEKIGKLGRFTQVQSLTIPIVIAVGLIQCLGILLPGTSRSAATIIGLMLLGGTRVVAAEFSFFLAIPTILGASGWELLSDIRHGLQLDGSQIAYLALGTVTAFLVALLVVRLFMQFISKRDLRPFGWYRIAVGAVVIILFAILGRLA